MDSTTGIKFLTVDEYITGLPQAIQERMQDIRKIILKHAPGVEELISYNMPAYKLHSILVYFAAHKKHIGFYPMPSAIAAFKKELSLYKGAKGSVQFPHHEPLPLDLIEKIIKFRINENMEKATKKHEERGYGY